MTRIPGPAADAAPDPLTPGERAHFERCSRFPCQSCDRYARLSMAPEHAHLTAIRQNRADLTVIPRMPVRSEVLAGAHWLYCLCTGCGEVPGQRVFTDADGCTWCESCACSDAIGAAFTHAEASELYCKLANASAKTRGQLSADVQALRDELLAAFAGTGGRGVPNPYGLAFA